MVRMATQLQLQELEQNRIVQDLDVTNRICNRHLNMKHFRCTATNLGGVRMWKPIKAAHVDNDTCILASNSATGEALDGQLILINKARKPRVGTACPKQLNCI